jgi:hypothetical protein
MSRPNASPPNPVSYRQLWNPEGGWIWVLGRADFNWREGIKPSPRIKYTHPALSEVLFSFILRQKRTWCVWRAITRYYQPSWSVRCEATFSRLE